MKGIVWMFLVWSLVEAYADIDLKSAKEVKQITNGLRYVRADANKHIKKRRLKRYYLGIEASKPLFFSIDDDILELYMAAFLQNAHPYWLEDDVFVFHTSSNKNYLKRLQRSYKRRYNIKTVIYKNAKYKKGSFAIREVAYDAIKSYMDTHIFQYWEKKRSKQKSKSKKQKAKRISPKKIENKGTISISIQRKKEANIVYNSFKSLDKYSKERSATLGRYILYTKAEKPWLLGSMDKIYNLYLIAILNGAHPKWLEDERFVFHTSSNIQYLKRLKKVYNKRYHLKLSVARVSSRMQRVKTIDSDALKRYMLERIPEKYIKKVVPKKASKVKHKKNDTKVNKKSVAEKKRLEKARQKKLQKKKDEVVKAKKRVKEERKRLEEKKKRLEKKKSEEKKRSVRVTKKFRDDGGKREKHTLQTKLWEKKKKELALERKQLEEEKRALAEAKKRLAEEQANHKRLIKEQALKKETEEKQRIAEEKARIAKKKRIQKQKEEAEEKKRLEKQKRKVAKEREIKRKLVDKRAREKKAAEVAKKRAEAKSKKEDALTSELDKMLEDTSNFKKKLERSESIKYY